MLKKITLLIAIVTFFGIETKAQCVANAGPEKHWCRNNVNDTITLGEMPILGYSYKWSINPISLSAKTTFYASTFLSDTTVANPKLIDFWEDEITFFLEVIDSNGNVCFDTTTVTSSLFAIHLSNNTYRIYAGDSVQLASPNVGPVSSMFGIDSVLWRPNIGLSDSNALAPWAKPMQDVSYYVTIWDEAGCSIEGPPFQYVFVGHVGIDEQKVENNIEVFPTVLNNNELLHIKTPVSDKFYKVTIYDSKGIEIIKTYFNGNETNIDVTHLRSGMYICSILNDNNQQTSSRFIIQ